MRIFLLSGKTSSGKDEVAKLIKENAIYNYKKCVVTRFAKNLESFVKELTEWDGNPLTTPLKDFQEIGASIRGINPDYFINNMLQDLVIYEKYADVVVIEDAMLPREIDVFKTYFDDVYAINIINQFKESGLPVEQQIDLTEIALENYEDFDYVVVNDDLEKLKDKVFKILEEIKWEK